MDELELWAASGAMALTGREPGPPRAGRGRPASYARDALAALGLGNEPLSGPRLLTERAARAGFGRRGPTSCGGAMRILPAHDGHVAIALPRPEDRASVPALVESVAADPDDPWPHLTSWAAATPAAEVETRLRLLGMAGGAVPGETAPAPTLDLPDGELRLPERRIEVLDLSALWAGPLCTRLLAGLGARVLKVESRHRPDGLRRGHTGFYQALNVGKRLLELDLPREIDRLRELAAEADVVVESSRPRALAGLGLLAEDVVAQGTTWVSITARGRNCDAIGFGDDVAACAGLGVPDGADLLPMADALADPLTGIAAAVATVVSLHGDPRLVEVSMLEIARGVAGGEPPAHAVEHRDGRWWVDTEHGRYAVRSPAEPA